MMFSIITVFFLCSEVKIDMQSKLRRMVFAGLFFLVILYGCFVPVRLSKDFKVKAVSLFGLSRTVKKPYVVTSGKGNRKITVYVGNMKGICTLHPQKPQSLSLKVSGSCYAGQCLKREQVEVLAEYADGEVLSVSSFDLPVKPFSAGKRTQSVTVSTVSGDVSADVSVMRPVKMSASYEDDISVGSYFNVHKVAVMLYYKDDTSVRISDFVVHNRAEANGQTLSYGDFTEGQVMPLYPERLDSDVDLYVITPYGNTGLSVHPKKNSSLKASYDETIYQCEKMVPEHLKVTVDVNGKTETLEAEKDFVYPESVYLVSPTSVVMPTIYGDVHLLVQPVMVKKVKILADTPIGGQKPVIQKVVLIYEDNHKTELKSDDVTWLNLPDVWADREQTLWFSYHGFDFSGTVNAVSGIAVRFREGLSKEEGYPTSDADVEMLSLICQRVGNDHLNINLREVAVLLNRYALNRTDEEGVLAYVYRDGYWGDESSIKVSVEDSAVNDDVFALVQDAVVNGYRVFPTYVTERIFENEVKEKNSTDYERDMTVLTLSDGRRLRFYDVSEEDASLLYCYDEDVYERVTGQRPPDAVPNSPVVPDTNDSGIVVDSAE